MKMSEVAKKMSVKEFSQLCTLVDQVKPNAKFTVASIERKPKELEVKVVLKENVIQIVKLETAA